VAAYADSSRTGPDPALNTDWRRILLRHLLALVGSGLSLGFISGAYGWSFAACLAFYLGWLLHDLLRLRRWLENADAQAEVPQARGLWGELFDRIYHQQRRERQGRERLQAVIDRAQESTGALRDAVIMLDSSGNLEWWNPAAETLLGLKGRQDEGLPVANLVRHPRFKEYFDQEHHTEPLEIPSPINEDLRLQFLITRYGRREHLMLVRDVTRVHQLEQMRKDFVANVSHELRTPLTVIAGYLETLLDNDESANPRWRRAMQQMQEQAGRMQNLLNDLLLLARLEATDYPSDNLPVMVEPLLQSIRADALALSGERGHRVQLDMEVGVCLKGSEAELRSAFSNLVFNAVKYTPAGGDVRIRWWSDSSGAHLAVADSGVGIEAKHLPRLTERFYRVDSSRALSTGGTGLGLAIVKHVLLRHRGKLEISSVPGKGSLFICHFAPAQVVPPASAVDD
jgi:two-component system phosphate regulon sensor histidine kinase PhoR